MLRLLEPLSPTNQAFKATPLLLSEILACARQPGGDIGIQSEIGKGTTVSLYLPRSAEAAGAGEQHPSFAAGTETARPRAGTAILVVEDDPRVSRSTVAALEELGYAPTACSGGREALDILERNGGIELIVTDIMMPEMTGTELVRQATALYPWIGILFVTGYVGEAGDAEGLSGYDILRKPFTVSALAEAVATALARRPSGSHPSSAVEAAE